MAIDGIVAEQSGIAPKTMRRCESIRDDGLADMKSLTRANRVVGDFLRAAST